MLTKDQLKQVYDLILTANREKLEHILGDPNTPILLEWAARIALVGMEQGDVQRLEGLLERLVGKVPTENHNTKDIRVQLEQVEYLKKLPTAELKRLAQDALADLPEGGSDD